MKTCSTTHSHPRLKRSGFLVPELRVELFDKENISRKELQDFYEEWEKVSRKRKSIDIDFYESCLDFIYRFNGHLNGVIVKDGRKIIGVSFFSISPLKKQSVGISSNAFCEIKGLSEFLTYERYRFVRDEYGMSFMNIGSANSERIINMKNKFRFFREKLFILVLKGNELRDEKFWHDDCLDRDDSGI